MHRKKKIIVQGYPGSFHDEAARRYFSNEAIDVIPADSFDALAKSLTRNTDMSFGVMAIENSIAGSLLQNYRILREYGLRIHGEVYMPIRHQLLAMHGQAMADIREVHSHPMAIRQCLAFFNDWPNIRLIESEDTAASAERIRQHRLQGIAAIASRRAAELNDLDILAANIETHAVNYTRFFIVSPSNGAGTFHGNKASVYLRIRDEVGSLLAVLTRISNENINMSKLQSYPIPDQVNAYFFHLDLEFDDIAQYQALTASLGDVCMDIQELGVYKRAALPRSAHAKMQAR